MTDRFDPTLVQAQYLASIDFRGEIVLWLRYISRLEKQQDENDEEDLLGLRRQLLDEIEWLKMLLGPWWWYEDGYYPVLQLHFPDDEWCRTVVANTFIVRHHLGQALNPDEVEDEY